MGLIGSNFRQYVKRQVYIRQTNMADGFQVKGQNHPDYKGIKSKQSLYESTPWMRLASGVLITPGIDDMPGTAVYDQILQEGLLEGLETSNWHYSGLARKCVLQGTVNSVSGKRSVVGAVSVDNPNGIPGADGGSTPYPEQFTKAYGWGYNDTKVNSERGYVPPPGVTSIDFEYKNDGALAQAKVNIKCFSREQFAIIDILYMRPGYTVLLEFGHTVYKNNAGETVYADSSYSKPLVALFKVKPPQAKIKSAIAEEKADRDGNYEGFFGRITKFNWKYNNDGSYDITVNLTGLGDVISSLTTTAAKAVKTPFSINSDFVMKPPAPDVEYDIATDTQSTKDQYKTPITPVNSITGTIWNFAVDVGTFAIDGASAIVDYGAEAFVNTATDLSEWWKGDTLSEGDMEDAKEEGSVVISNAFKSQLNYDLYSVFADKKLFNDVDKGLIFDSIKDATIHTMPLKRIPINGKKIDINVPYGALKFDVYEKSADPEYSPTTLITFGVFLAMLQRIANVEDEKQNVVLEFDLVYNEYLYKVKKDKYAQKDFMVTYPGNFSSDPNKVLIQYKDFNGNDFLPPPSEEEKNALEKQGAFSRAFSGAMRAISEGLALPSIPTDTIMNTAMQKSPSATVEKPERFSNPNLVYPLANVFVNVNMIAELMNSLGSENEEEELEVPVLALVDAVLNEISICCGGINEFRTIYNEDTGRVEILSESPVLMVKKETSTTLITNGFVTPNNSLFGGNQGSFVKSMDLNSELSDAMATQITIGAQSNGNSISGGATSFSAYSKGLIDNTFVEKKPSLEKEGKSDEKKESVAETIVRIYKESKVEESFKQVYDERNFDESEHIDVLKNSGGTISSLLINQYFQSKTGPAPFFLPFNMSLTLKGLGGLRIYDAFKVDGKSLPLSYNPKDIKLIIKSLSHSVTPSSWDTKISTISTVDTHNKLGENNYKPVGTSKSSPSGGGAGAGGGGGGSTGPVSSPYTGKTLPDDPAPTINPQGFGVSTIGNAPQAKVKYIKDLGQKAKYKSKSQIKAMIKKGQLVACYGPATHPGKFNAYGTTNSIDGKYYYLAPVAARQFKKWVDYMVKNKIPFRVSSALRFGGSTGAGPHGYGCAVDFGNLYQVTNGATSPKASLKGRKTEIYKQIATAGAKFNWYNPKRMADNVGSCDEIWHFEYWGPA